LRRAGAAVARHDRPAVLAGTVQLARVDDEVDGGDPGDLGIYEALLGGAS